MVIIIDDVWDTGKTLKLAHDTFHAFPIRKIITFVIVKKRKCSLDIPVPDYFCFNLEYGHEEAESKWLFGYGMDIPLGEFRDCDYIAEYDSS